jgi:hypothetical protein
MVILKKFYLSHITKRYLKWLKDKDITKHTSIKSNLTYQQIKRYIKQHQNNKLQKLFRIFYFKKHVGNIRISLRNNTEVSFAILIGEKNYHNLGIGTQSLKQLIKILKKDNIKSIVSYVSTKNSTSVSFFKKNNFFLTNKKEYFLKIKRSSYLIFKLNF